MCRKICVSHRLLDAYDRASWALLGKALQGMEVRRGKRSDHLTQAVDEGPLGLW